MSTPDPFDVDALAWQRNGHPLPTVQSETPTVKARRDNQFLPAIPERVFIQLVKLPRKALAVYMVILLRCRLEKSKTVTLTTAFLSRFGLTRKDKAHALIQLEAAGLLKVERRERRNPTVTLLK
jgi:hypothetical protein